MKLNEYLKANGITRYRIAKDAGLPLSVVYKFLSGSGLHLDSAIAISRATNGQVSVEELTHTPDKASND